MIKRCPVHSPARSRAVLVLLGGYDNSFQAEVVLAEESPVAGQILADDDGLGVGDESEAGDAECVLPCVNVLESETPFVIGDGPLLAFNGHHGREFHRLLGLLVQDRTGNGVGLSEGNRTAQQQNHYQKQSPHNL